MRGEAGFSLIEVLLAAALFVTVALGAFETLRQLSSGASHLAARHLAYAGLERLSGTLRAEARSATAIWSSAPAASAAYDGCVQLDFYTADAGGPRFWSYRAFPHHASDDAVPPDALERLAAAAPIAACDPSLSGAIVLHGLQSAPTVTAVAPNLLAAHADAYLRTPDSGFVAASVPATAPIPVGVLDANGNPVAGGNTVLELRLDTGDASRVLDLVAGAFPNGFTEVLQYTCSARCDVGHDAGGAKTLTACAMSWQTAWSEYVVWNDATTSADGSLTFPGGWFIAGDFVFTYSGTRASDGGTDTFVQSDPATNWDATRNYVSDPPNLPTPAGTWAGSFAPWNVVAEAPAAWLNDFGPYLAAGELTAVDADQARCAAVQAQGSSGGFYTNG
ncbi:MAG TPA: prepilin-type N-terminal cleavage/methylation domain-containing protein [Candidatus Sulfotelmatobacter sp.]|nr:prepilin-type N-terminal cleavage/methylation domain-containing protein [Candidatus Sulfotelmatobacter sp.]